MSSFPGTPRILKGGIVLIDPGTAAVRRIISLQYNPDTLTRSFRIKGVGTEGGNRSEAMRLSGPPVETYKLDAEIDATDQLESADVTTMGLGIQPQLSVLETIVYPSSATLISNNRLARNGSLEIIPMESAMTLFVWSKNRVIPVRLTEFSIVEEAFDADLNPVRAKVSISMQVLTTDDLGFGHTGSGLYMSYQQNKERLAGLFRPGKLSDLGINTI